MDIIAAGIFDIRLWLPAALWSPVIFCFSPPPDIFPAVPVYRSSAFRIDAGSSPVCILTQAAYNFACKKIRILFASGHFHLKIFTHKRARPLVPFPWRPLSRGHDLVPASPAACRRRPAGQSRQTACPFPGQQKTPGMTQPSRLLLSGARVSLSICLDGRHPAIRSQKKRACCNPHLS